MAKKEAKESKKEEVVEEVKEEPKEEAKEVVSDSGKYRRVMRNGAWILKDADGNIVAEE